MAKVNIMNDTFELSKDEVYDIVSKHGKYDFDLCTKVKKWFELEGVDLDGITPVYSMAESKVTGIECRYNVGNRKHTLFLQKDNYKFGEIK